MQLPDYDFKRLPEALKAAGIALAVFAVTLLLDFGDDLDAILTDPEAYVRSMVPALLTLMATAFLGVMTLRRNGAQEIEKRLEELKHQPGFEPFPPAGPEPTFEERIAALPEEERASASADVLEEGPENAEPPEAEADSAGRWLKVSINGKVVTDTVRVPVGADKTTAIAAAVASPAVRQFTEGRLVARADYDLVNATLNLIVQ